MKRIFLALVVMGTAVMATAQTTDKRFYIGANARAGNVKDRVYARSFSLSYDNAISDNYSRSKAETDFSTAYGFDAQVGYFFSPNHKWGISTGVIFMQYDGTITVDNMHVEYQSWDKNGDTYRQLLTTTRPIKEDFTLRNISIPLVMKFRTSISKKIGFVADAGVLYNIKAESQYTGKAAFNYEAIYKLHINNGQVSTSYDDAVVPDDEDWMMTIAEYQKDKGDGNEDAYFEGLRGQGYNVGLNKAAEGSGTVNYKTGSLGILLQTTFTYQVSDAIQANLGLYYMHQNFRNTRADMQSRITDRLGEYNSIQRNLVLNRNVNYGLSLGLSMFLF